MNINNRALISGPSYDPSILAGLTWSQIAGGLNDATNPVTQAIVGTANYMSRGHLPSTNATTGVGLQSSGVQTAAKALKLG